MTALRLPPTQVQVMAALTDGTVMDLRVSLPDIRAALILKALAYRGRLEEKDAVDVWRLLVALDASGLTASDWPSSPTGREAAAYLHQYFSEPPATGARRATESPTTRADIQLLVGKLVPVP